MNGYGILMTFVCMRGECESVCEVTDIGGIGSCGNYCPHCGCVWSAEYHKKVGDDERRRFYCECHSEHCEVDDNGFGSCGDYNRYGACIWCDVKTPVD